MYGVEWVGSVIAETMFPKYLQPNDFDGTMDLFVSVFLVCVKELLFEKVRFTGVLLIKHPKSAQLSIIRDTRWMALPVCSIAINTFQVASRSRNRQRANWDLSVDVSIGSFRMPTSIIDNCMKSLRGRRRFASDLAPLS